MVAAFDATINAAKNLGRELEVRAKIKEAVEKKLAEKSWAAGILAKYVGQ